MNKEPMKLYMNNAVISLNVEPICVAARNTDKAIRVVAKDLVNTKYRDKLSEILNLIQYTNRWIELRDIEISGKARILTGYK